MKPKPLNNSYLWPLSKIEPNPDFPRKNYTDAAIEELAGHIKDLRQQGRGVAGSGLDEPLTVFSEKQVVDAKQLPDTVMSQTDNLILFAAQLALKPGDALPVVLTDDDPRIARLFALRRVVYGGKWDFESQAKAVAELAQETAMTYDELAAFLGEDKGWVQLRVDVHHADEAIKKLMRTDNLAATGVQRINRVADEDARAKFIQQIRDGVPYYHISKEVAAQLNREHATKYVGSSNRPTRRSRIKRGSKAQRIRNRTV